MPRQGLVGYGDNEDTARSSLDSCLRYHYNTNLRQGKDDNYYVKTITGSRYYIIINQGNGAYRCTLPNIPFDTQLV